MTPEETHKFLMPESPEVVAERIKLLDKASGKKS
jgi:hypothetical protein